MLRLNLRAAGSGTPVLCGIVDGITTCHAVLFAGWKMAAAARELLIGQPLRKKHRNSHEFALYDKSVQARIKHELRSCLLKQQTWYVTERSLLVFVQANLMLVVPAKRHRWRQIRATAACCA